jgi:hypothetical protein
MKISVVIPAHNPRGNFLRRVFDALSKQTLALAEWELILIDNASTPPLEPLWTETWHPGFKVVREEGLGLMRARMAGFKNASGKIILLVDDDNVLAPDYLEKVCSISDRHPFLGTWSGRVELSFEPGCMPVHPPWRSYLTERLCPQALWSNDPQHLDSTPWGAGMCIRREVALAYLQRVIDEPARLGLDLQGGQLIYGGDTDIAYFGCRSGWGQGVFPELLVEHLMPPERCEESYLLRSIEGRAYSECLHHHVLHGQPPLAESSVFIGLVRWCRNVLRGRHVLAEAHAKSRGRARARKSLTKNRGHS